MPGNASKSIRNGSLGWKHALGGKRAMAQRLSAICNNTLQTEGSRKHFAGAIDGTRLHAKDVTGNCNYRLKQRLCVVTGNTKE